MTVKSRHLVITTLLVGLLAGQGGVVWAQIRFKPPEVRRSEETADREQAQANQTRREPDKGSEQSSHEDSPNTVPDTVVLPIPDSIVIPQIDFSNQPIQNVLRLLSAPYGVNLAVDPGLNATVTLRLTDVRLKDALRFIVEQNGLAFRVSNNIISVYKPKTKRRTRGRLRT